MCATARFVTAAINAFRTQREVLLRMEHLRTRSRARALGSPSATRGYLLFVALVAVTTLYGYGPLKGRRKEFKSPDARLLAIVVPADKKTGIEGRESRILILRSGGAEISMHDFSSKDGDHGYGVLDAQWTPDSQYFVCRMTNSGGHSPTYVPVVFWNRKTNHFYQLEAYTADHIFSITASDRVKVESWPDLQPAVVSLSRLREGQVTELR